MKFGKPNFRTRLFFGAVLPALLMVSVLEGVFITRYRADIERAFFDQGRAVARQIGSSAEYALFAGNTDGLRVLTEAARQSSARIIAVAVLDASGTVLAHSGPPPQAGLPLGGEMRLIDGVEQATLVAPILRSVLGAGGETDLWSEAASPDHAAPRPAIGHVVVQLSRSELTSRQREMLQITIAILLGGLLLAGWLSFRIAAKVLRQLDAAAAELRRQKEIAEALAHTDPLTGLANRRAFDEIAQQEVERAKRYGTPLAMVMADLDHFKVINDTHGHHVGDQVLQHFARLLQDAVRGIDLVGRWGGEEFVILLPGTVREEALLVAERMRQSVADTPAQAGERSLPFTASFGVAEFQAETPTMDSLLGRADAALYRAKDAGRNLVEAG